MISRPVHQKDTTPQENHAINAPGLILSRWMASSYSPCLPAFSLRTSSFFLRTSNHAPSSAKLTPRQDAYPRTHPHVHGNEESFH